MNDNFHARMILTTAVFAAAAALLAGPASAHFMDVEGGGSASATPVTAPPTIQPGMIPFPSDAVDQSQGSGTVDDLDPAIRTAIAAEAAAKAKAQASATPGAIPYLSHVGVDQSLLQSEQQSLGLTGDSPISRVVGQEPAGLTGDSPRTRGQVLQANASLGSTGDTDVDWTWVGFGAGMAALLAAAMGGLYLSARRRDRVALP
jgi:hypothetical protein